jgi:magnesium-transporting ATPase (P-type)
MPANTPIYGLRPAEVYPALETSPRGLSPAEAQARRSLYGENILHEQAKAPEQQKILEQFLYPQTFLLTAIGLVAIFIDQVLGIVILSLVLANGFFSYWRERRAMQAVEKLQKVLPDFAHILRAGEDAHLPSADVVPGDILILAEGDNIPADARVVEEYGLRTNNATLTGESMASRRVADASFATGISDLERPNLIFAGTSVQSGTGRAVVYATGMLTQFGRIAHLTQSVEEQPSPFRAELTRLSRITTYFAIGISALAFLLNLTNPDFAGGWRHIILFSIGIMVAVMPEGLTATLTLSLAMAVQRLAQKGVLAKKLEIVETLGNVSVICTDKSGTLTQNQMTVRDVWVARQRMRVTGAGYEPKGAYLPPPEGTPFESDLHAMLDVAVMCNNARLNEPTPEHRFWTALGDQTEAALKVAALKSDVNERALEILYPRFHEIPFDARRKRMTTIHREEDKEWAFVKGAPREVLQLCNRIQINAEAVPLTNELRAEIMATNDDYARGALRVLAMARRQLPLRGGPYTPENIERDLTFLGLMAMMDPPRPEVERAIQTCREASIRIVMITGDYGLTAESIARRVGMLTTQNPLTITGAELDQLGDLELQNALSKEVIFARMAPEHKMRLVSAFQARGDVVAVTGDGVNDAPALRKADVGIAMGIVGTDVAKEAADIILTNDNFASITQAIEEGRAVYDNIRKFMTYIFASNIPEIMPFLVTASLPGFPIALNVRQILAIDLGTDIFPALALGVEDPEPDIMKRAPRSRHKPLIESGLLPRALWLGSIESALCFAAFISVYLFSGHADDLPLPWLSDLRVPAFLYLPQSQNTIHLLAGTVYHVSVVMTQIGNAFACRSEKERGRHLGWFKNHYLLFGVGMEIIIVWALVYFEQLRTLFEQTPLPIPYWIGLILFPFILYNLERIRKGIVRWLEGRHKREEATA